MIIDIDNEQSVVPVIRNLTADWFSIDDLYFQMKADGKTDRTGFWIDSSPMLDALADCLAMAPDNFRERWNHRCSDMDLRVMGYHCTRQRNEGVFLRRGILPLSNEVIAAFFLEIKELKQLSSLTPSATAEVTRSIVRDNQWKNRLNRPGPCFLMSYKEAKIPDNDYHQNGPEVWWLFVDHLLRHFREKAVRMPYSDRTALRDIVAKALRPFIIHCEIPYAMIPSKDFCTLNILRAYFSFVDPDDEGDDDPEEISAKAIDLNGKTLEPKHFTKIEAL